MASQGTPTASGRIEGAAMFAHDLVVELLAAPVVANFATLNADGSIHLVSMWFAHEGQSIVLATGSRSLKVENLERNPAAALMVHDSRAGFEVCGVSLTGRGTIVRSDEASPLVERVHRRYVAAHAEERRPVGEFLQSDDVAIRFTPERALFWDERRSEAARQLAESGGAYPLLPTSPRGT
jgi:PPOX class probable F420-dependent enzyme